MKFFKFDFDVTKKVAITWSLIVAFCLAFFFTSNSPFFRYDTWADSSVYTQVGHNWLVHGMVPYKDIFDHKGPLHFLLFGIGSLIRVGNSYIGIYIIEALLMSVSIYYYYLTVNLYVKSSKLSLLIATIAQLIIFTTVNFQIAESASQRNVLLLEKGGSPEEFCLPFISILVYYCSKVVVNMNLQLSKFEWLTFGLSCSAIFLEKFTLSIPFMLLFGAALVWVFFKEKSQLKNALIFGVSALILPLIITVVYFKLNHALSDFITYYFKVNLFNYAEGQDLPLVRKLYDAVVIGIRMLKSNYLLFIGFFAGISGIIFTNKVSIFGRLLYAYLVLSIFILSLMPGRQYAHYLLPVIPVILVGFAFLIPNSLKEKDLNGYGLKLVFSFIVVVMISVASANEQMMNSRIKLFGTQTSTEKMADIIKSDKSFSEENTNVLVLFSNNAMIHTLTNTTPKTRFFYRPAMEIPQYNKEIISLLKHKTPKYLLGYYLYAGKIPPKVEPRVAIMQFVKGDKLRKQYLKVLKNYKVIYKMNNKSAIDRRIDYLFIRK